MKGGDLRPTRQTNRLAQILSNEVFAKLNKEAREIINKLDDEALRKLAQDIQDNPELKDQWIEIWNTFSKAKPSKVLGAENVFSKIYSIENQVIGQGFPVKFYGSRNFTDLSNFNVKYQNLELGYSGVIDKTGKFIWKVTYNLDPIKSAIQNEILKNQALVRKLKLEKAEAMGKQIKDLSELDWKNKLDGEATKIIGGVAKFEEYIANVIGVTFSPRRKQSNLVPRRGSHASYKKYLKLDENVDPLFAFALNIKKGKSQEIEIGFFSNSVNSPTYRKAHKTLKITKSGNARQQGILKPVYQENVIRILEEYFGEGYKILRKVDTRGGKDFYW